ncbi:hypothetical protein FQN54_004339 [Arachnomyces sp. PD_36]|nr:hypothetical protein FQN54_004339 [Arachnomyces sp. PD_36]
MAATLPQTLAGKVAIVTGGSRGIGAAISLDLARRGARVTITYASSKSDEQVASLLEKINTLPNSDTSDGKVNAIKVRTDLRDPNSAEIIVKETLNLFQTDRIDIVVNNAGAELVKPLQDVSLEDFAFVYDLNVRAPMLMVQAVRDYLPAATEASGTDSKSSGGRIINIGSVGSRSGFKNLSLYCSSKAALEGLTRCWAAELGENGHSVNTVNPGPVQTELLANIPQQLVELQRRMTPMQHRTGTLDDIVGIVGWLASEESRWVTGQTISASGGWAMY